MSGSFNCCGRKNCSSPTAEGTWSSRIGDHVTGRIAVLFPDESAGRRTTLRREKASHSMAHHSLST